MAGLGLSEFLNQYNELTQGGGYTKAFNWKKDGKAILWLSQVQAPKVCFVHNFLHEDVGNKRDADNKKTDEKVQFLRYPRFVGPDPLAIYQNQHFRSDNDSLRVPPHRDVFLILREYLRIAVKSGRLAPDATVFEWTDHKQRKTIAWEAAVLGKVVKGNGEQWKHTLDGKFEVIYTMIDNANIDAGPQMVREGRGLADAFNAMLKQQIDMRGEEEGDPTCTPYAVCFEQDKNASPANMYKVYRYEGRQAPMTPALAAAIQSTDVPDVDSEVKPGADDETKIRAAMEAAARIDIPFDALFSPDLEERASLMQLRGLSSGKFAPKTQQTTPAQRPPATPGATRPTQTDTAPPATTQTSTRVRKAPPPVATEPCVDCDFDLPITATKCPKCGAEYDVTPDATAPAPVAEKAPAPQQTKTPEVQQAGGPPSKCMACGSRKFSKNADGEWACDDCGLVEDNLPF